MEIGAYDVDAAAMPEGGGEAKSRLFVDRAAERYAQKSYRGSEPFPGLAYSRRTHGHWYESARAMSG
jgi:hypothetical protein